MLHDKPKTIVEEILSNIDIQLNGDRPWDLQVYNDGFYRRVLSQGSLGLGESYIDGWWDAQQLDAFFTSCYDPISEAKYVVTGKRR